MTRTHLLLALLIVTPACGGGGSSPASPSTTPSGGGSGKDETPPVLSVPFVAADQTVAFFVFGATLPSGVQNPTFEVETPDQTPSVFAVSTGKGVNITSGAGVYDLLVSYRSGDVWGPKVD